MTDLGRVSKVLISIITRNETDTNDAAAVRKTESLGHVHNTCATFHCDWIDSLEVCESAFEYCAIRR